MYKYLLIVMLAFFTSFAAMAHDPVFNPDTVTATDYIINMTVDMVPMASVDLCDDCLDKTHTVLQREYEVSADSAWIKPVSYEYNNTAVIAKHTDKSAGGGSPGSYLIRM